MSPIILYGATWAVTWGFSQLSCPTQTSMRKSKSLWKMSFHLYGRDWAGTPNLEKVMNVLNAERIDQKLVLFNSAICCCCCSVAQSCPTLRPHGLQHARLPCPSLSPGLCSNSWSLCRWCHPTISSSVVLFSCLQCFPASGSFLMSRKLSCG